MHIHTYVQTYIRTYVNTYVRISLLTPAACTSRAGSIQYSMLDGGMAYICVTAFPDKIDETVKGTHTCTYVWICIFICISICIGDVC